MNRVFTLTPSTATTPSSTLDGSDELGRLFEFRIEALADSHSLSLKDMLGKPVTVRIEQQDLSTRYLNGIVARASLSGRRAERYYGYELIVRPWLWLATRRSDCRIFQNKTVPEIVQEVLPTYGFRSRTTESYVPRDLRAVQRDRCRVRVAADGVRRDLLVLACGGHAYADARRRDVVAYRAARLRDDSISRATAPRSPTRSISTAGCPRRR